MISQSTPIKAAVLAILFENPRTPLTPATISDKVFSAGGPDTNVEQVARAIRRLRADSFKIEKKKSHNEGNARIYTYEFL